MTRKIAFTIVLSFITLSIPAQKKTLLKFEFPVGVLTDQAGPETVGQKINFFYPTLYIPLHKHLDIGVGYTNQKVNYFVREGAMYPFNDFAGKINYKVTSLYLKINLSASQKRVNPFFSYVLSFSKGVYTSPTSYNDSLNGYVIDDAAYTSGNAGTNLDVQYFYNTRMKPSEEAVLKKSLGKSQLAHGVQIGLDYKILPFLNIFAKVTSFSVMGYAKTNKKPYPFAIRYNEDTKYYHVSTQQYYMWGIILKIDGGKKSLIK